MNLENRNKGFSLIELIVTIAIMALVTGASMSIYSWIKTHRVEEMVQNIDDCISELRTETLTKQGSYSLRIRKDGDNYIGSFYKKEASGSYSKYKDVTIGSVGIIRCFLVSPSAADHKVNGINCIEIMFDKSGSVSKFVYVKESGGSIASTADGEIEVEYAGINRKVVLSKVTGKHYIE